jgi:hypothetical protein
VIIKVERERVTVRAEQIEQEGRVMYWSIEGRRDGMLTLRYRLSGHAAMVDVFAAMVSNASEMLRVEP